MATALDTSHNLASERSSIESTYELTKYLEYQLKEIKDIYLTYLGPPFNEKDFSPPRPNSTALSLPIAATRLDLWHGLENQARLAQNQKAYSVLLAAVRELARSTLCPSLKTSLLHFCTGLDGLLGSISALMTTLGYGLPPPSSADMASITGELQYPQRGAGGDRPAPLMSQSLYRPRAGTRTESGQRNNQRRSGMRVVRGEREDGVAGDLVERRRGKEGRKAEAAGGRSGGSREKGRGERGRRGRREEPESSKWTASEDERVGEEEEEELEREAQTWGGRRRLLSINDDGEEMDRLPEPRVEVSYPGTDGSNNQYSYNLNSHQADTLRKEDGFIIEGSRGLMLKEEKQADMEVSSSFHHQRRPPRSLLSPTLQPPLSTLSLLYQFGAGEEHTLLSQPVPLSLQRGTSLLSPPLTPLLASSSSSPSSSSSSLLSVRPTMNDFARKVEGFWILRELQSWLWRSAKDFNRLKKRLRG
ncbi:Cardiotrophin-like cytokine factor 1 B-cell-stimulating factor 3 [Larimichthys crocea]|uniref:Cardiotrophin-like cytokine factor 1 B-cell-stimulating factor 3 n=1 Tax=Larimichthys crocea TaxID=215358 RepID=A0A6G0I3H5_LARCR|nr:Cardiotrophin-like cytokine factor 1 B-cell-stimulating factor 3 [Larimichthys crocea]